MEILGDIHGITENTVKEQLATLKSSGDYRRIVGEVAEEARLEAERIEREPRRPASPLRKPIGWLPRLRSAAARPMKRPKPQRPSVTARLPSNAPPMKPCGRSKPSSVLR